MNLSFQEIINQFLQEQDLAVADQFFATNLQELDCDRFTYTCYARDFKHSNETEHELCSPFMQAWQNHFLEQHYDEIDTVAEQVSQHLTPVFWNLHDEIKHAAGKTKQMFAEALEYGLSTGLSIPIHGPQSNPMLAILVVHHNNIVHFFAEHPTYPFQIHSLGIYYHECVLRLLEKECEKNSYHLTKREKECLELAAQHKSAYETACELGISERTVGFHIENTLKKLNARNKYQAVEKAIEAGTINKIAN